MISVIDTRNLASQKVATRLGEARGEQRELVIAGKIFTVDIWSISREEWRKRATRIDFHPLMKFGSEDPQPIEGRFASRNAPPSPGTKLTRRNSPPPLRSKEEPRRNHRATTSGAEQVGNSGGDDYCCADPPAALSRA